MATAQEWRAKAAAAAAGEAVALALPSGMTIRARRPDPMQLAAMGILPSGLVAAAGEAGEGAFSVKELAEGMRDLLLWCCVEPRISLTPGPEELHPREVPQEDWTYIIQWAMRADEVGALRAFRGVGKDGSAGGDGADVAMPAERAAGDRGSGGGPGGGPGGDGGVSPAGA